MTYFDAIEDRRERFDGFITFAGEEIRVTAFIFPSGKVDKAIYKIDGEEIDQKHWHLLTHFDFLAREEWHRENNRNRR